MNNRRWYRGGRPVTVLHFPPQNTIIIIYKKLIAKIKNKKNKIFNIKNSNNQYINIYHSIFYWSLWKNFRSVQFNQIVLAISNPPRRCPLPRYVQYQIQTPEGQSSSESVSLTPHSRRTSSFDGQCALWIFAWSTNLPSAVRKNIFRRLPAR